LGTRRVSASWSGRWATAGWTTRTTRPRHSPRRRPDRRTTCRRVHAHRLLRGHRPRHDPGQAHPVVHRHQGGEAKIV